MWDCLCDCGKRSRVDGSSLRTGRTQSCGCKRKETSKENIAKARSAKVASNSRLAEAREKIYRVIFSEPCAALKRFLKQMRSKRRSE